MEKLEKLMSFSEFQKNKGRNGVTKSLKEPEIEDSVENYDLVLSDEEVEENTVEDEDVDGLETEIGDEEEEVEGDEVEMEIEDLDSKEEEPEEKVTRKTAKEEKSTIEKLSENTMVRQVGRTVMREVTRGLLGVLGIGGKRKKGWF